jgi:L-histidine N-alpha-methyltransferase
LGKSPLLEAMQHDVRSGLSATPKMLPPYLFYDEAGSLLYEQITAVPEYYLTRLERQILERSADEIVDVSSARGGPFRVIELGAGSATKTELVLRAALRRHGSCTYVPVDVSRSAVEEAAARLRRDLPEVTVEPYAMPHADALRRMRRSEGPDLVLFIGSSVGNFEDDDATKLLSGVRDALGPRAWLLLGTDLAKDREELLRAYDDSQGVTAAFNKNVLERINREMNADFDTSLFRHVARWNAARSRIEMHLESLVEQTVIIPLLEMRVHFGAGETIHTESSIKYDLPRVKRLLASAGFRLERTFYDPDRRFAVHLSA